MIFLVLQEERLLQLYDEHGDKGPKYRFEAVAEDLAAGFSANQVKRQLQAMGIVPGGKKKGARARGSAAWDALLGSDDDVDAVVDPGPRSQERQARSGSDSSSASSSSSGSDDSSSDDSSDDEDDAIAADRAAKEDFWAEVAGEEGSASPGGAQEGAGEPMEAEPGEQGGTDEEDAAAEVEKKRRAAALDAKKSKKKLRHDGHAVDEHLAGPSRAPASPAPSPSPGGNKRKAPGGEVEGTPSPVKRARALAALRKKRFGAAADVGADPSGAAPEAATEHEVPLEKDTTQPETVVEEDGDDGQKENVAAGAGAAAASPAPAVKTFGRRLLKRTGTTEPAGEAMLFDDLEDF